MFNWMHTSSTTQYLNNIIPLRSGSAQFSRPLTLKLRSWLKTLSFCLACRYYSCNYHHRCWRFAIHMNSWKNVGQKSQCRWLCIVSRVGASVQFFCLPAVCAFHSLLLHRYVTYTHFPTALKHVVHSLTLFRCSNQNNRHEFHDKTHALQFCQIRYALALSARSKSLFICGYMSQL